MLCVDWSLTLTLGAAGTVLVGSILAVHGLRNQRPLIRIPLSIASILCIGISGLFLLANGCTEIASTHSGPLYSPDRTYAFTITDYDAGALGGWSVVTLHSNFGLTSKTVYSGDWKAVELADIHWLTKSEVMITYPKSSFQPQSIFCGATGHIRILCQLRPNNS